MLDGDNRHVDPCMWYDLPFKCVCQVSLHQNKIKWNLFVFPFPYIRPVKICQKCQRSSAYGKLRLFPCLWLHNIWNSSCLKTETSLGLNFNDLRYLKNSQHSDFLKWFSTLLVYSDTSILKSHLHREIRIIYDNPQIFTCCYTPEKYQVDFQLSLLLKALLPDKRQRCSH